jgi:hypothetical protein
MGQQMTTKFEVSGKGRRSSQEQSPGLQVVALVIGLALALVDARAATFEAGLPDSEWQFGPGVIAPWAAAASVLPSVGLAGQRVQFSATRGAAPDPLACGKPRYEYLLSPAEGLFQGLLPAPAEQGARSLGMTHLPLLTLRVTCDGGVFDYHLISPDKALLGLDNIVWPLDRRGGKARPEQVALALFQSHLTHDMAFTPATVARKHGYLTKGLQAVIAAYFRRPVAQDEVPPINGDPFTNTQEYPNRFVPGRALIEGRRAVMPVRFGDDAAFQVVEVLLHQLGRQWRVDDLRYEAGGTLRSLLQPAPRPAP